MEEAEYPAVTESLTEPEAVLDWLSNRLLRSCLQPPVLELQAWIFFYMGGGGLNLGLRDSTASALMH